MSQELFETGDRVRPKSPTAHWRKEKIIVDRVFEENGIIRLDLKVYFQTGGGFLAEGHHFGLYEHWYSRKARTERRRKKAHAIRGIQPRCQPKLTPQIALSVLMPLFPLDWLIRA